MRLSDEEVVTIARALLIVANPPENMRGDAPFLLSALGTVAIYATELRDAALPSTLEETS